MNDKRASKIAVRAAILGDADGINDVYNPFIHESVATFEVAPYDRAQREAWLTERAGSPRWPVFVADYGGAIGGFCSASAFDPRGAYETSVKVSVFVAPEFHGQGIAGRLYDALFAALPAEIVHRAYGLIVAPNPASVALHERFGFAHVATLNQVGRKFGRYLDVMWFEKRL